MEYTREMRHAMKTRLQEKYESRKEAAHRAVEKYRWAEEEA